MKTKVTELLQIEYPIIQGGMAWVAEHRCGKCTSGNCEGRDQKGKRTD